MKTEKGSIGLIGSHIKNLKCQVSVDVQSTYVGGDSITFGVGGTGLHGLGEGGVGLDDSRQFVVRVYGPVIVAVRLDLA